MKWYWDYSCTFFDAGVGRFVHCSGLMLAVLCEIGT